MIFWMRWVHKTKHCHHSKIGRCLVVENFVEMVPAKILNFENWSRFPSSNNYCIFLRPGRESRIEYIQGKGETLSVSFMQPALPCLLNLRRYENRPARKEAFSSKLLRTKCFASAATRLSTTGIEVYEQQVPRVSNEAKDIRLSIYDRSQI